MPTPKTTYEAHGILIEITAGTTGDGINAKLSVIFANDGATITDLVKAALLTQRQLSAKAAKAKLKVKAAEKKVQKKEKAKARKAVKAKIIAVARAPRKRKAPQVEMFPDAPDDQINTENMEERLPSEQDGKTPAPITANSCVMG